MHLAGRGWSRSLTLLCVPPFIFLPSSPLLFYWISLREKKKKKREREREERRQTCALIYLSSLAMLATAHVREKENVMVLFIVTVAVKKKGISVSHSPHIRPPVLPLKRMERNTTVLPLRALLHRFLLTPLIILSSFGPSSPLVCLYHCLDAFSRGMYNSFLLRSCCTAVVNRVGGEEERAGPGRRGERNKRGSEREQCSVPRISSRLCLKHGLLMYIPSVCCKWGHLKTCGLWSEIKNRSRCAALTCLWCATFPDDELWSVHPPLDLEVRVIVTLFQLWKTNFSASILHSGLINRSQVTVIHCENARHASTTLVE